MLQWSISATATMSGTKQTHRPPTHSATRRILSPQIAPPCQKPPVSIAPANSQRPLPNAPLTRQINAPSRAWMNSHPCTRHRSDRTNVPETGHAFRTFSKNSSRSQFSPEIPPVVIAVTPGSSVRRPAKTSAGRPDTTGASGSLRRPNTADAEASGSMFPTQNHSSRRVAGSFICAAERFRS